LEVSKDELEQLIEDKVEKRLKERQRGEKHGEERETDSNLSRRDFLKGLAGGAGALGAASMLPSAAGYQITSSHSLSYYNQSSADPNFEVTTDGTLDVTQIGSNSNSVGSIHSNTINTERVDSNSVSTEELSIKIPSGATVSEIETVINNNPGCRFLFPTDDSLESDQFPLTVNADDVTLDGGGRPFGGFTCKLAANTQENVIEVYGNDVAVMGFEVDGNGANQTDGGSQNNQCGIYFSAGQSMDDTHVRYNHVHDTGYSNVRFDGTGRRVVYENNVCHTTYFGGSETSDCLSITFDVERFRICDNLLWGCQTDAIETSGGSYKGAVTGNIILGTQQFRGIHIHDGGEITVGFNVVVDSAHHGIVASTTHACIGNVVINASRTGINAAGPIAVIGNYAAECGSSGIDGGPNQAILGNTSVDNGAGIQSFGGGVNTTIAYNHINNNGGHGALIDQDEGAVTNNTITNNAGAGVFISAADVEMRENYKSGNNNPFKANGTRHRHFGIIGGGPFGGVDISTITGASTGDRARTTGASAAPADVIAVFDGADWIYPTKGGAVTPT